MSKIKQELIPIQEWVKERLEQLARIQGRIQSNIQKYRLRKSASSDGSDSRQSLDSRDSREARASAQNEEDEIADDWRKLKHTLAHEIPLYMSKHTSAKMMKKIMTVRQQADRVTQKIESRIQEVDLRNYRYKQSLKKWESDPKISAIRSPSANKEEEMPQLEEVSLDQQEKLEQNVQKSLILEDLNSIGSDKLKKLDRQVKANQKLVSEYENEKGIEKRWTLMLLGLILVFILADLSGLRIETRFHQILFDFVSG